MRTTVSKPPLSRCFTLGNVSGGKKKGPRLLPQPGAGRRGAFPVCALCGEPILGDTRYYFRRLDKFVCPACISWAEEPNEPFEIEYPEED